MKKLAMLLVVIISFSLGVDLGLNLITYVFEEENVKVAESVVNDSSSNETGTKDENDGKNTNDVVIAEAAK